MYTKDTHAQLLLLEIAIDIRINHAVGGSAELGICGHVAKQLRNRGITRYGEYSKFRELFYDILSQACQDWEYYSGSSTYPIQGIDRNAADEYCSTLPGQFFDGEYGRRRLELLDRTIEVLKVALAPLKLKNEKSCLASRLLERLKVL
jgi:hypothetical protein